jgi:hypothetical protein
MQQAKMEQVVFQPADRHRFAPVDSLAAKQMYDGQVLYYVSQEGLCPPG